MADSKISNLNTAPSLALADVMPMVDVNGDITYKFSFQQLLTFLGQNSASGATITFGTATIASLSLAKDGDIYVKTDTGQFAQQLAGTWTVVYTIVQGVVGNQVTFGTVDPTNPASFGIVGDVYINTNTGGFWKQAVVSTVNTWVLSFTLSSGPAGPRGNSILNGTVNPVVGDGTNGDFFLNTVSNVLFGPKSGGVWPGTGFSLAPLVPTQLLNGTTDPDNTTTGHDGDFYINTSTLNIFGPKASGVWPAGIPLGGGSGTTLTPATQSIPAGSTLPFIINYPPGFSAYGDSPILEIWQVLLIEADTPTTGHTRTTKRQIFDVPIDRLDVNGTLTTLKIYGHDSGDGLTTVDDLILIVRST